MNNELKIVYKLQAGEGDQTIVLELELSHGQQVRGNLMGNGKGNYMLLQAPGAKEPVSPFLAADPLKLAQLFDPTFALANKIDSQWLVEKLLAKREEMNASEDLIERIKALVVVSNLMGLHAVGSDVMNELYGYNWVVEQSADLIKKSKDWLDLIARIEFAQEQLKVALSS
jgi:hypothetical protein